MGQIYKQRSLFETKIPTSHLRAGSLRTNEAVHEAVKEGLNRCEIPREDVAKELSRLVGEDVSIHTLNNCCAEGKTNRRFPLVWAKALAMITGHKAILDAAIGPEFLALDAAEQDCLAFGEMVIEDEMRSKRKKQLKERVKARLRR